MKMPFPIHVTVTLEKEGTFSCPPEEFRGKMSAALKDYFSEKLEEEPWSDIEATLCFVVQRIPLFKEKRMMLKLKNIRDERANGQFEFKVFLTKKPEVYPSWDDQESDDEEVPADVLFGMKVDVKVESIDSLKKSCGVLVANMTPGKEKPLPNILLTYVKTIRKARICARPHCAMHNALARVVNSDP